MKNRIDVGKEYQRIKEVQRWLRSFINESKPTGGRSPRPAPKNLKEVRVASVMDPFSELCFSVECEFINLDLDIWKEQISKLQPHLLFIESAWEGKNGKWAKKVSSPSEDLGQLIDYCHFEGIPVVFWNKEDPVHFERFLWVAKRSDVIFTTDLDIAFKYPSHVDHERIFLLPFGASPRYHNPVGDDKRSERIVFAGSYYPHFQERNSDLLKLLELAIDGHGLDIYDRNHKKFTDHVFPEKYRDNIVGSIEPDRIGDIYKGYRYGITVNTIKDSQTMFARRVFEQMACNMVTLGIYTRAMHNLLGDLVLAADDASEIKRKISIFDADPCLYRKFRLLGLREVLFKHTYKIRLSTVVEKTLGITLQDEMPLVTVIATVSDPTEAASLTQMFRAQSYPNKDMVVVFDPAGGHSFTDSPGIVFIPLDKANRMAIPTSARSEYTSMFHPEDHYDINYLMDMVLAFQFASTAAVTKAAFYKMDEQSLGILQNESLRYATVSGYKLRRSVFKSSVHKAMTIGNLLDQLLKDELQLAEATSIDEFNYCEGAKGIAPIHIRDIEGVFTGVSIDDLNSKIANGMSPVQSSSYVIDDIPSRMSGKAGRGITMRGTSEGHLVVTSDMAAGSHDYIKFKEKISIGALSSGDHLFVKVDTQDYNDLDCRFALVFLDDKAVKISSVTFRNDTVSEIVIPEGTQYVWPWLRVSGSGSITIKKMSFGEESRRYNTWVSKSPHLVLTNNYPSYENLYNNAFVHRRIVQYRKHELKPDVFEFTLKKPEGFAEFEGVDVVFGHKGLLRTVLESGGIKVVMVHFLHNGMWNLLKSNLDHVKIVIYLHGSEVQQWYRRGFNFVSEPEKMKAQIDCEQRNILWREVFSTNHPNLHFVFVSKYFLDEVTTDLGVDIPSERTHIIHNFIDTDLYDYVPKGPDQRFKVLSIRPFASMKYANDLSVEAIIRLSKRPIFNKMEFRIIGDGELFDEVTRPLKVFPNVMLERRFLRQEEIAAIHKEYGIFLVPTRMDSQGVSRDEAMSSGLVPVTNKVTAIPEFVDDDCGILVDAEDSAGLAGGIERLVEDPDLFLRLSRNAAARVREQSGEDSTIVREVELVRQISPTVTKGGPIVSIIIPVYNVKDYLERCLDSIVAQKNVDYECILVDDGSNDGSERIVDDYAKAYPDRFKAFHKTNGGQGSARNIGMQQAKGTYLTFVDSDDWIEEDMLAKMMGVALKDDCDLVVCDYDFVYPDGGRTRVQGLRDHGYGDVKANVLMSGTTGACIKMFSKELLSRSQFEEDLIAEDFRFTVSAILRAKKVGYTAEVLYHYYRRPNSTLEGMRGFSDKNYHIFEAYRRLLAEGIDVIGPVRKALFDRMIINVFNWRVSDIHAIRDPEERRAHAAKWAMELNNTIPNWQLSAPIVKWMGNNEKLKGIVECYAKEEFGVRFDQLLSEADD